jgi:hypothetical protein
MSAYMIQFDGQTRVVDAPGFTEAIEAWHEAMQIEWGDDYDGTEQPESVALIDDDLVIRWVDPKLPTLKEQADLQVLAERDRAEDALSRAYQIVVGKEPEWSNYWGHKDAIEDIEDAMYDLKHAPRNTDAAKGETE